MAVLIKGVSRPSDPTDKNSAKKIYPVVTYKYSNPMLLREIAKELSAQSGMSEGSSISVVKDFRTLLKKSLIMGRVVNIEGFGYFYLAASAPGAETREKFTVSDITKLRICFQASSDIRLNTGATTRTEGLVLKDVDRINTGEDENGEGGDAGDGGDVIDPMG